jgi:Outer membrane protein beta-barrel domain
MRTLKPCLFICVLFFLMTKISAQNVGYLYVQGHHELSPSFGGGAFLELGYPLNKSDYLIFEPNIEYYSNQAQDIIIVPILAGYRYLFSRKEYGLYVQPVTGYSFGSTKINETKSNGDSVHAKASGFTAGLGIGYAFNAAWWPGLAVELRYMREFITDDPQLSVLSFRLVLSTISLRKRRPH